MAVVAGGQHGEGGYPGDRGHEGGCEGGGRDLLGTAAVGDEDRREDGSTADAIDAADA
jgi:hypothetical protein